MRLSASAPLVTASVACGFPSPAEDHLERPLDLNELYRIDSPSVFLVRVAGESMTGRGLFPGDVAVVDKAKPPRNDCIVVACLNGDFTMKTYQRRGERVTLKAENPAFPNIEVRLRPTARCGASSPAARGLSEHGTAFQPHAGTKTWNPVAL